MNIPYRPIVWTIAGSDSGGGAGIQADLRAIDALHCHGASVITALTAQNSTAVQRIEAVSPAMLNAQCQALAEDLPPRAIKTGMLGNAAHLACIVEWIERLRQQHGALPLVVDPVLAASSGYSFADDALLQAYRTHLLPAASVLTPNRQEAARLAGMPPLHTDHDVEACARRLQYHPQQTVVITGGDCAGSQSQDYLLSPQAQGWLSLPRVDTPHSHGSGCSFASAIAAALAHGHPAADAVILAKIAVQQGLQHSYAAGGGRGPVHLSPGFAQHPGHLPALTLQATPAPMQAFPHLSNPDLGLYVIVDSADWVARVLRAGVRTVQLRIKNQSTERLRSEIRTSVQLAAAAGAQLFINDHWQLALEEGAYGVHLGQEDLMQADLPRLAAAGLRLGLSSHSYWEVCRALPIQPSYLACGPVFPTTSKQMPWQAQGLHNLYYWCQLLSLPVVAVGGLDSSNIAVARQAGAAGVALIRAVTESRDPETAIQRLQQAIQTAQPDMQQPLPAWANPCLPGGNTLSARV